MARRFLSLALFATAFANASGPLDAQVGEECNACSPSGATGSSPPSVGADLDQLYYELLDSVKDIHFRKRWADRLSPRDDGFCCRETLDCVNVETLNVPMCYDKFTTQYKFPDGSWGSLTTGEYNAADGSQANLIQGNYTKTGGETGNIYGNNTSDKPNTSTLSIPPQFTGSGVGSAIPASDLASIVLITTTIPGSVITTPTTLSSMVSGHMTAVATITTPTSLAPETSVITSTVAAASSTGQSTGAAGQLGVDSTTSLGMSLFTALMYAIYAL
ncbi:hypothetical protein K491DRAFT_696861 [Lophiostoma macrostomum CBS 122681]|uniref:Uncharacterized protein n=1 Tax=Lophiostoma macrostomum CBS 122681 TaxID=1314788 RepID=A0A6A6ST75_9PLEO|nr:hypothetical protein K491DRAFT_696861 [Lophiostoma macrostomum CBS 122681]